MKGDTLKLMTKLREEQKLSKAALSRKANMNDSTIGWIENGRYLPYDVQLEKIAAALGYEGDPKDLMNEAVA